MKRDIKLTLNNGAFDIAIENGDFANEPGFDTAIWISLFSDARADESQVIKPENRRGWLGNTLSNVPGRQLGSYLWLAEQRRLTQDTVNEIEDYARKSLWWMIEDGILRNIEVTGEIIPRTGIKLGIKLTAHDGDISNHFIKLWELTGNAT